MNCNKILNIGALPAWQTCLLLIGMGLTSSLFAQNTSSAEKELLSQFEKSVAGPGQIDLMLDLASHYLFKDGENESDLRKSLEFAKQAKLEASKRQLTEMLNRSLVLIGTAYIEGGDLKRAANTLMEANAKARVHLAINYSAYHRWGGKIPSNLDSAIFYAQFASKAAAGAGDPDLNLYSLKQLADIYAELGKDKEADSCRSAMISMGETVSFRNPISLHWISEIHSNRGSFNKALYFELETLKLVKTKQDSSSIHVYYYNLASMYRYTGQFEKSLEFCERSLAIYKKKGDNHGIIGTRNLMSEALMKMNRHEDALALLNKTAVENKPQNDDQALLLHAAFGKCYTELKQFNEAEHHLKEALRLSKKIGTDDFWLLKIVGQFYTEARQYEKARPYLETVMQKHGRKIDAVTKAHLYFLLFRVDSAAGNYVSAIDYLMKNKNMDDSVLQTTKVKQIQELQVQYETAKKDQDLQIKEQNILLLTRMSQLRQSELEQTRLQLQFEEKAREQGISLAKAEAEKKDRDLLLKQQSIQYLEEQSQLKQSNLLVATQVKNLTLAGIALLTIIVLLLYYQYQIKQRKNSEISLKNIKLERLIHEKEWLLKEVHHRVKNNLHTVMSLLESQSAYLEEDALAAIKKSQHRVYAMSLIHQRLYQSENNTNIDMAVYLPELIMYLRESFGTGQSIRFQTKFDPIVLDISKAIPIGLILNEAITNSIKYAFPDKQPGEINIDMRKSDLKTIRLTIADNGIGLPSDWKTRQKNSLGLKLMQGLSDDIQGQLDVLVSNGTQITLEFREELVVPDQQSNTENGPLS